MRSTLIIRGIPQDAGENNWNKTESALADYLNSIFGWNKEMIKNDIERAHRGSYKIQGNRPSPIFMKLHSWKTAQIVLKSIASANRNGKINIYANQMYSTRVQEKINELLKIRKTFKEDVNKKLWKSYVTYPGILMVKKEGEDTYSPYRAPPSLVNDSNETAE